MSRVMKDSGIEWIGKIPEDWKISKYKFFSETRMGETILKENLLEDGIPVYSATEEEKIFGYVQNSVIELSVGDLVIPARGNSIGYAKIIKDDVATCTQTTICSKLKNIISKYVYYCTIGFKDYWFDSEQTAIPQITVEQVKNNMLVVPSIKKQTKIANFLDEKCEILDKQITNNQKSIELLEEYKESIISELITSGIYANVKFKEVQSKYFKYIPQNWSFTSLKYLSNKITDGTHQTPNYIHEGYPFISIKDISSGKIDLTNCKYISSEEYKTLSKHTKIEKGDILFCRIGTLGKPVIVDIDENFSIFVSLGLIKPKHDKINNRFLKYVMGSSYYKDYINLEKVGEGTHAAKFNLNSVAKSPIILPSLEEQKEIADYLDDKCSKIDRVIEYRKQIIEKLEEYKKSLIYEAVTGKIEV
ncbi:MAG TPA: restriction endonuclease subunit S [Gallicola sp.]|nr:restriction endonuclease subunit S [Gallicola sp.]